MITSPRLAWHALICAVLAVSTHAMAADGTDALDLQSDAPGQTAGSDDSKLFVEGAIGHARQRYGLGSRTISRATVDARHVARFAASAQATLSARIDATDPQDERISGTVFSLREAYVGWQDDTATHVVEFGRINLREGPGYGYNPTDFFRDHALRTITTVNPFTLRENRMGTVMLRAQRLWPGGSLAVAYAPKLESRRSDEGFSADLGATNARDRALLTLSHRVTQALNAQALLYKEQGSSARVGASLTALLSDAAVVHAEWSHSRESDLLSRALGLPGDTHSEDRGTVGVTYTTATRLSLTAEYQYNGFALDRRGWRALESLGLPAQSAYFLQSQSLQDNAARHAVMLYAVQRDLGVKNLDLTGLVKLNRSDRSRMLWLDLRYRLDTFDVALQAQHNGGDAGSEFGIVPVRNSVGVVGTFYF